MIGEKTKGKKELCKACKTKYYRKIFGVVKKEDYGFIVIHKKDCSYLKKLLENSIKV